MNKLNIALCSVALLIAGLLGVTLSLPMQAPAIIILGVGGVFGGMLAVRNEVNLNWAIPAVLGIVYFLWRAWRSPAVDLANEDIFLIVGAGLLYMLAGPVAGSVGVRVSLAWVVILLLVLHLCAALQQMSGGRGYGMVWQFVSADRPEGNIITGMYGYRGSFANFSIIGGMLSLCLGVWGRFAGWTRVLFLLVGFSAVGLACLAQSRSAMISLGACGVVFLVMLWVSVAGFKEVVRKRFRFAIVVMGCAGLLIAAMGANQVFQKRAQDSTDGVSVFFDSDVRLGYWSMAADQFSDHPMIGSGSRSFAYESFAYWSPNLDSGEANPEFVHNEYLQLMTDYGLLGLLIAVGLLGAHFITGTLRIKSLANKLKFEGLKQGSNAMALGIAGVAGITAMLVHVIFDFRTHLLANLLLLICCLVWVLPVVKQKKISERQPRKTMLSVVVTLLVVLLGLLGSFHGIKELRGGLPLMKNKMAAETGTWNPAVVPRNIWIPSLEKSISMAPSFRRHLRLGTLYRLEAESQSGDERKAWLSKAIVEYEKAAVRHPFDPVSVLNLASLHTYLKEYEVAERYFMKADELASSRERWFRIHTKWADMYRQWGGHLWTLGNTPEASQKYEKALEILEAAEIKSSDNTDMRFMVVIEFARMLDDKKDYEKTDQYFAELEKDYPLHIINSLRRNIRREMGNHYMKKGKHFWYKRKPNIAYRAFKEAERCYRIHRVVLVQAGREIDSNEDWLKNHEEVKGIIKFLEKTGVGNN